MRPASSAMMMWSSSIWLRKAQLPPFNGIEGHEGAAPSDLGVVAVIVEQTDVADDNSVRVHSFVHQDGQLFEAHRPSNSVCGDGDAGLFVSACHGPEHPLLHGPDPSGVLNADLAQQAGLDVGAMQPHGYVPDKLVGQVVGLDLVQVRLIEGYPVPAGAQDNLQPRALGHLPGGDRMLHAN